MKRYCKNFEFTEDFIKKSLLNCLKKRWKRKDVSFFLAEYAISCGLCSEYDLKTLARMIRENIALIKDDIIDDLIPLISHELFLEIKEERIKLAPIVYQNRVDKASGKVRKIGLSSIKQLVYDYIAVNAIKNMVDAKCGIFQCASRKGKGQIYGVRAIKKWLRTDPHGTKYCDKDDIKKYFPSVNHDRLIALLSRDIKNRKVLYVLKTLIATYGDVGICIGSYLSQHLANYYLSYAYHYIEDNCFYTRRGKRINPIDHKLFYMDDIILFSSNKKQLAIAKGVLKEFLTTSLDLQCKLGQSTLNKTEKIDMMGYVILKKHTIIRKRNWKRIRRAYSKAKKYDDISLHDARRICSFHGQINTSSHRKISRKYKTAAVERKAKEKIRRCDAILQKSSKKATNTLDFQTAKQTCLYMI